MSKRWPGVSQVLEGARAPQKRLEAPYDTQAKEGRLPVRLDPREEQPSAPPAPPAGTPLRAGRRLTLEMLLEF